MSQEEEFKILILDIKGGLFSSAKKIKIAYRERAQLSFQLTDNDDCPLTNNLKGMYGFVASLPAANTYIRDLLLQKIHTLNCEFSILQELGETKELKSLIRQLALELDAILFVQPNTIISKSEGQHFLDSHLNLVLDGAGNCDIDDLAVSINSVWFDGAQDDLTEEQKSRKSRSEQFLDSSQVKTNKNLPGIESSSEVRIRKPAEIAQRVTVLAIINGVAFDHISGEGATKYLQQFQLWEYVTEKEKIFLANPTAEAKNQETWKCECIWTLLWALNKVEQLGLPDQLCDLGNVEAGNYPIGKETNPVEFINAVTSTRSAAEILDANDLYYRLDWACVDARINGRQLTTINPSLVYERHYALNWLINYKDQDWDNVTCDT